jgi:hypothetical protein
MTDTHRMLVFSNPIEGREIEFNTWYEEVHMPEVLGTPGIVAAQRFELSTGAVPPAPESTQQYLAVYEIEGDPAEAFAAMVERSKTGEISRGEATDPTSLSMLFYSPRTGRITG